MNHGTSGEHQLEAAGVFDEHRGLLLSVAYRILGSVADAEDTVQEAYLRWSGVDHSEVHDPRAFLVRVSTRLAIDRLRRARTRRESYVGPWLPEPVLTGREDPSEEVAMAESVSMAMLVVLETLAPRRPVRGAQKVASFLLAIATERNTTRFLESIGVQPSGEVRIHPAPVNGEPGAVITTGNEPISALVLDVSDGLVHTIRLVANPENLTGVRALGAP